jgi:UDP-N-acetylmuramyl pentapeptide phosphotransferase/UDP-N-acetylglucosamine-1-phosphate transferase
VTLIFILLGCLIAFVSSAWVIPGIIQTASRIGLFDKPEKRKLHTDCIPRLGGFSFLPLFLLSVFFTITLNYIYSLMYIQEDKLLLFFADAGLIVCGLILLYLVGIKDDLVGVRYLHKFIVQFVVASLIPLSGLWINNLYGLLGIHCLSPIVGIPLTVLLVIFIINAVNLIDGIDGLASGLCIIGLAVMGGIFIMKKELFLALSAFVMGSILIPFFYYNVFGKAGKGTKIFMGDTGSLTLGYFLAFFALHASFDGDKSILNDDIIMIAFAPLLIPMLDVCRVMFVRFRNGKHLFTADNNHIHHKFLQQGFSHRQTLVFLLAMSALLCVINLFMASRVNVNILVVIDGLVWVGLRCVGCYMNPNKTIIRKMFYEGE